MPNPVLLFNGGSVGVLGLPMCDVTEEDLSLCPYSIEQILSTGIYRRPSDPAPTPLDQQPVEQPIPDPAPASAPAPAENETTPPAN